jgi:dethiobiotin synthetase
MRPERILFVTGTDTGVGKTFVGAALLRHWADRGRRVVGVKPVETGCGGAIAPTEDGAILALATRQTSPRAALTRLAKPVAPPLAAEAEGAVLSPETWYATIDRLSEEHELVLVEGAGGLLSPLTWQATLRDLIRSIGARALVIACDRLGSINHALLTTEALGRAAIGVVFSAPVNGDESTGTNADAFRRMMPAVRAASMDRFRSWEQAAEAVAGIASWVDT